MSGMRARARGVLVGESATRNPPSRGSRSGRGRLDTRRRKAPAAARSAAGRGGGAGLGAAVGSGGGGYLRGRREALPQCHGEPPRPPVAALAAAVDGSPRRRRRRRWRPSGRLVVEQPGNLVAALGACPEPSRGRRQDPARASAAAQARRQPATVSGRALRRARRGLGRLAGPIPARALGTGAGVTRKSGTWAGPPGHRDRDWCPCGVGRAAAGRPSRGGFVGKLKRRWTRTVAPTAQSKRLTAGQVSAVGRAGGLLPADSDSPAGDFQQVQPRRFPLGPRPLPQALRPAPVSTSPSGSPSRPGPARERRTEAGRGVRARA